MLTPYDILSIPDDATPLQIAAAYSLGVAGDYHPLTGNKSFRLLADAYRTLIKQRKAPLDPKLYDDLAQFVERYNNNPHAILGVNTSIEEAELKNQFKHLRFLYHPDTGGNEIHFKVVEAAYDAILTMNNGAGSDSSNVTGIINENSARLNRLQQQQDNLIAQMQDLLKLSGQAPKTPPRSNVSSATTTPTRSTTAVPASSNVQWSGTPSNRNAILSATTAIVSTTSTTSTTSNTNTSAAPYPTYD